MDCKITFGKKNPRLAGGGLLELMIAVAVGVLVIGAAGQLYLQTSKGFLAQLNYVDLDSQSRLSLDQMSQQIRMANSLASYSATNLVLVDFDNNLLTFGYNASTRTVSRTKSGVTKTLLTGCDSLQFSIFQRSPNGGNGDFYSTTNAAECKLVQMTWTCSRTMLGIKANTETMQTAKVMMRNKP